MWKTEKLKNLTCTRIKVQILIQPLDLLYNAFTRPALVCMSVKLFHLNDLFLNLFDDLKHLFGTNMHKNKKWRTRVQLHHHDSEHLEAAVSLHGCNSCSWKKLSVKIEIGFWKFHQLLRFSSKTFICVKNLETFLKQQQGGKKIKYHTSNNQTSTKMDSVSCWEQRDSGPCWRDSFTDCTEHLWWESEALC